MNHLGITIEPGQTWIRLPSGTDHVVDGPADIPGYWDMIGPAGNRYVVSDATLLNSYVLDLDQ